ncbi:MAG: fatty acid CoA ligase family protein [Limisphaerales bacterium]
MSATVTANIASHLAVMAERQPDRPAVLFPARRDAQGVRYTQYTFRELDTVSSQMARGFERIGIRRGTRTALLVPPSLDFFALTFALFKLGAVPVLIDPGIGLGNFANCLAEAEPQAFIGISKAQAARVLLGWAPSVSIPVTVGTRWFWGGHTLEQVRSLGVPPSGGNERTEHPEGWTPNDVLVTDETAAILFTSGSTGPPKGVVYTHEIFTAQVEHIRALYGIQPGEVDLPTFPLFALFGPALGMTEVLPEMDFTRPAQVDPEKIITAIERFGVTNMFGSPAVINRLGRHGETRGAKLPTLRRAISAGAPVPAKALARFAAMLPPGAQVFTPYGATECLPVASIGSDEILAETCAQTELGKGVCVGRPVPGLTVKIIRITDEPIPAWSDDSELPNGEIGEIAVQAPHATRSYFNRPTATARAKIPTGDGKFFHRMGDVGYLDERGRIWFCGRKSHRVVTKTGTHFTIPCEAIFNTHPGVFRSALVGVPRGGDLDPVVCIELEADARAQPEAKLREELLALAAKFPHTQAIRTVLFHPAFPVDIRHNAKIFREKLAVWTEEQLA